MKKLFNTSKTKNFWVEIVLGALCILAAIIFAPIWAKTDVFFKDWGKAIVDLLIAALIVVYLVGYLWKKMVRSGGIIRVLTIVEFCTLSIIALGCIFTQFKVINVQGACKIFGLALWCRGVVELFRAYYLSRVTTYRYSPLWLVVAIVMVTFGTYCFAKPFIQDEAILWVFVSALFVLGILFVIIGCMQKPVKAKVKSVDKNEKK